MGRQMRRSVCLPSESPAAFNWTHLGQVGWAEGHCGVMEEEDEPEDNKRRALVVRWPRRLGNLE